MESILTEELTFTRVLFQRIGVVDSVAVFQPAHETLAVLVEADKQGTEIGHSGAYTAYFHFTCMYMSHSIDSDKFCE